MEVGGHPSLQKIMMFAHDGFRLAILRFLLSIPHLSMRVLYILGLI